MALIDATAWKDAGYLLDDTLSDSVFLSLSLNKPLLLEGESGTGKTSLAQAAAAALGRQLIRLQCYEGIDAAQALYEWNYPRQLSASQRGEDTVFGRDYLLPRPLLQALEAGEGAVLLVDEIDRSDEAFEAFLLETLAEFQVTVPELGTIRAVRPPLVVLTSNRTRPLSDALRRRALYHFLPVLQASKLAEVLALHVPEASPTLVQEVVDLVGRLRAADLIKPPGPAEAIDVLRALRLFDYEHVTTEALWRCIGLLVKDLRDLERVRALDLHRP